MNKNSNFLQSEAWAKFQKADGNKVVFNDDFLAILEHGKFANRLYLPYGPVISANSLDEIREIFSREIREFRKIAKTQKLDFIRVEPEFFVGGKMLENAETRETLRDNKFRESARFVQPPTTVISDLSGSDEDIKSRLSQTARRYAKKCARAGISYSVSYKPSDIREFLTMIHEVSARTGAKFHDDLYFQTLATSLFPTKSAGILFAEIAKTDENGAKILDENGAEIKEKIASIIFYLDKNSKTMSYAHAANKTNFRKFSPATGLGLFALFFAKKQGCETFDWFGVAPEKFTDSRYNSWAGLTQFKMSFGGERITRPGTWELPMKKQRYFIYRALLKITGRG